MGELKLSISVIYYVAVLVEWYLDIDPKDVGWNPERAAFFYLEN